MEFRPLNNEDYAGVIAELVVTTISAGSVTLLLLHIISVMTAPFFSKHKPNHNEERVFLRMQLGVFVVCLLFSDLCQAIGGLLQAAWIGERVIRQGAACTAQGILVQFGDVGTAVWNFVVAFHTFYMVVLGKRMSRGCVISVVIGGWGLVILFTVIGPMALVTPNKGPFYGVGALRWCFIRDPYSFERLMLHYPPILASAFFILVFYSMVFLTLRGNLNAHGWHWTLHWKSKDQPDYLDVSQRNQLRSLAKKVLWYPVVYIILILPVSICRIASVNANSPAWTLAMCFLVSMGCANSALYAFTRRIGPSPWIPRQMTQVLSSSHATQKDIGSTGTPALKEIPLRSPLKTNFPRRSSNSFSSRSSPENNPIVDIGLKVITTNTSKPEDSVSPTIGSFIIPNLDPSDEELDEAGNWHQGTRDYVAQ